MVNQSQSEIWEDSQVENMVTPTTPHVEGRVPHAARLAFTKDVEHKCKQLTPWRLLF